MSTNITVKTITGHIDIYVSKKKNNNNSYNKFNKHFYYIYNVTAKIKI